MYREVEGPELGCRDEMKRPGRDVAIGNVTERVVCNRHQQNQGHLHYTAADCSSAAQRLQTFAVLAAPVEKVYSLHRHQENMKFLNQA